MVSVQWLQVHHNFSFWSSQFRLHSPDSTKLQSQVLPPTSSTQKLGALEAELLQITEGFCKRYFTSLPIARGKSIFLTTTRGLISTDHSYDLQASRPAPGVKWGAAGSTEHWAGFSFHSLLLPSQQHADNLLQLKVTRFPPFQGKCK